MTARRRDFPTRSRWIAGRRRAVSATALVLATLLPGCAAFVQRVGIALFYRGAEHPSASTRLDLAYVEEDGVAPAIDKHRLDLFLPESPGAGGGGGWPTLVFVHGGGWVHGDRAQVTGGADLYRNIGRFFAQHGVGAAVISYRLQPDVTWAEQVEDVSAAVRFVRAFVTAEGGRGDAIFLSGHSAGAHLSARYAMDEARGGASDQRVCGLILVSGAAYDLADAETYALGADRGYFEERFRDDSADWARRASVIPWIDADSPPALVLYAAGEPEKLRHQSDLLVDAYQRVGVPVELVVVPGEDHERIVLTLSRDDKTSGPAMLDFIERTIERTDCGDPPDGTVTVGR